MFNNNSEYKLMIFKLIDKIISKNEEFGLEKERSKATSFTEIPKQAPGSKDVGTEAFAKRYEGDFFEK